MAALLLRALVAVDLSAASAETPPIVVPSTNITSTAVTNAPPPMVPADPLVWDATTKIHTVQRGETNAVFSFCVTNMGGTEIVIRGVRPSCGCTLAKMPSQPWVLQPGDHGPLEITVDVRGKRGVLNKFIAIDTSVGLKLLHAKIVLPETPASPAVSGSRGRNLLAALADRQAVFKGDCVNCHVKTGEGKLGEPLYQAVCGICHDVPNRASMVPDLRTARRPTNQRRYWNNWIRSGKVGSLMPGFAAEEGGPLNDAQIESLVKYLLERPAEPPKTKPN